MTITNTRFIAKNGLDNNNQTITNVADPVNIQDVATKNYVINSITGAGSAVSGVTAGTYGSATQVGSFTVDATGSVTGASNITVTPSFSSITSKPTTLAGYGITDGATTTYVANIAAVTRATAFVFITTTSSWTIPTGVTSCKVFVGGAGGGGNFNNLKAGGDGGLAIKYINNLTPGASVSITIGTGGTSVTSGNASSGTPSSFGAYCSATGGAGATNAAVGANGTGVSGDLNISGGGPTGSYGLKSNKAAQSAGSVADSGFVIIEY
jgi:hypothetical protein